MRTNEVSRKRLGIFVRQRRRGRGFSLGFACPYIGSSTLSLSHCGYSDGCLSSLWAEKERRGGDENQLWGRELKWEWVSVLFRTTTYARLYTLNWAGVIFRESIRFTMLVQTSALSLFFFLGFVSQFCCTIVVQSYS